MMETTWLLWSHSIQYSSCVWVPTATGVGPFGAAQLPLRSSVSREGRNVNRQTAQESRINVEGLPGGQSGHLHLAVFVTPSLYLSFQICKVQLMTAPAPQLL